MPSSSHRRIHAAFLGAVIMVSPARALIAEQCEPEIIGCGKGQVMAAAFLASGGTEPASSARLEPMGDTDVQNCALDIEVSNLNPAGDTCTVTGTNAITMKSKSAALTQFTFLLHSNYTISSLTETFNADQPGELQHQRPRPHGDAEQHVRHG